MNDETQEALYRATWGDTVTKKQGKLLAAELCQQQYTIAKLKYELTQAKADAQAQRELVEKLT